MLLMLLAFFADRLNVLAVRPVGSGVVTLAVRRVGLADTSSDVLKAGVVINGAKNSGFDGGSVRRGWQARALRRRHGGLSRQLADRGGDDCGIRVSGRLQLDQPRH